MNKWGIPKKTEEIVKARDKYCVYCGKEFYKTIEKNGKICKPTWEHIDNARWNDQTIIDINVAFCCRSCNSSKGNKDIKKWFESDYCKRLNINKNTVADFVKDYLKLFP